MTTYTLTILDTGQIQRYVFSSNRLLENVGASELVERAARRWVWATLPTPHNVDRDTDEIKDMRIERDGLAAEVIYAGGGNTVVLFRDRPQAVSFVKKLTYKVLSDAPGLHISAVHETFDWDQPNDSLIKALRRGLSQALSPKKAMPMPSLPLLGLGVTAACNSTGLVASEWRRFEELDELPRLISREIDSKREVSGGAQRRFYDLLPEIQEANWAIPNDLDDLGRVRGEESYIAVVHADGNGMSQRVEGIARQVERRFQPPQQNREYILAIRRFSEALREAAHEAMQATMRFLWDALHKAPDLPHTTKKGQKYFPLRPIVFGGDDTTFICHGQYGLTLAVHYLEAFEAATRKQPAFEGQGATARAGVAVVKTHYPFARAYALSEQLAKSAKAYITKQGGDVSALDWHFAVSGITGSLKDIRTREYETSLGQLCARPILLHDNGRDWQTWPTFAQLSHKFAGQGWRESRNKTLALRTVLRHGPDAVREFVRAYRLPGGTLPTVEGFDAAGTGWIGNQCVYFDVVEALDFFIDLAPLVGRGGTYGNVLAAV